MARTPLHYACTNGHLNIAQYLIREEHCNPSCESNDGDTPLHNACIFNHAHIVQYLLSTGRVNPLTKNKYGDTALSIASNKYDIIELFEPFEECRTAFPVHTFTKLILTGDSGAGKTTITELIVRLASSTAVECVDDVQRLTAGIVPHHIQSEQLGNFVVYDFAGQQEYYSSHAVLHSSNGSNSLMISYLLLAMDNAVSPYLFLVSGLTCPVDNIYCTMWAWLNIQAL